MFALFFSRLLASSATSNSTYSIVVLFKDDREAGSEEDSESDCDAELPSPSVPVFSGFCVSFRF
jgi:hypothetical protein